MGEKGYWLTLQHNELPVKARKCLQSSQHKATFGALRFSPSQALNDQRMIYPCSYRDGIFFHRPHICYNCTSPIRVDAKGQIWPRACSLTEVSWETESICRVMNGLPEVSILQNIFVRENKKWKQPLNTSNCCSCVKSDRIAGTQARCDTEPYAGTHAISHTYCHDLWFFKNVH